MDFPEEIDDAFGRLLMWGITVSQYEMVADAKFRPFIAKVVVGAREDGAEESIVFDIEALHADLKLIQRWYLEARASARVDR